MSLWLLCAWRAGLLSKNSRIRLSDPFDQLHDLHGSLRTQELVCSNLVRRTQTWPLWEPAFQFQGSIALQRGNQDILQTITWPAAKPIHEDSPQLPLHLLRFFLRTSLLGETVVCYPNSQDPPLLLTGWLPVFLSLPSLGRVFTSSSQYSV